MLDLVLVKMMAKYLSHRRGCDPDPPFVKPYKDKEKNIWIKPRECSCGLRELRRLIRRQELHDRGD